MLPTFKEVVEELFAAGPGPGGLRHRDPGARHQHAGPDGGDRAAGQVERRDPRRPDRRGSTPSSPGGPGGAASTSRGTPSCSGSPAWTRRRWPGLAGTRTYPLNSSFRPSYNMAVNLVGQVGLDAGRARCSSPRSPSSRPTAAVVGPGPAGRAGSRDELAELAVSCDLGDFAEYAQLRKELSELEGDDRAGSVRLPAGRRRCNRWSAAPRRHHHGPRRAAGRHRGGARPRAARWRCRKRGGEQGPCGRARRQRWPRHSRRTRGSWGSWRPWPGRTIRAGRVARRRR